MRSCSIALAFVLLGALSACVCQKGQLYDNTQISGYMHGLGLETDPENLGCWADSTGRTVYIVGRTVSAGQCDDHLVLLSADRDEPLIVDLNGVDFQKQWVDPRGKVWDYPPFAERTEIDRSSGLFISYPDNDPTHQFSVGRADHPEGWLFSGNLPEGLERGVYVHARGESVVIREHLKSIKVSGFPSPRPHCWVYSPDPANPGQYRQTEQYWLEVQLVPGGKTALELDGDWLTSRLAARAD